MRARLLRFAGIVLKQVALYGLIMAAVGGLLLLAATFPAHAMLVVWGGIILALVGMFLRDCWRKSA